MLFALPGSPVIRYGDEIGMGDDLRLDQRDAVRTPMQWSDEPQAGFSVARRLVHPVISKGPYGYRNVNVEAQRRDPGSLLNWMIRMIRLRKECPEIGWGTWQKLALSNDNVLGLLYEWRGTRVLTLHNFSRSPEQVRFKVQGDDGHTLVNLLTQEIQHAKRGAAHTLTLDAFGYHWYRVGTLNYGLRRTRKGPGTAD